METAESNLMMNMREKPIQAVACWKYKKNFRKLKTLGRLWIAFANGREHVPQPKSKFMVATGLVISLFFSISWALVFNRVSLLNFNIELKKKLTGNMVYTYMLMREFSQLFKAMPYAFGIWPLDDLYSLHVLRLTFTVSRHHDRLNICELDRTINKRF